MVSKSGLSETDVRKIITDANAQLRKNEKDKDIVGDQIFRLLTSVMMNPHNPRQNHGEVCSLAMAKAFSIPVFFTDERQLQPIIDKNLNTGIDDITCVRIVDAVIKMMNGDITGFSRKQAKAIWTMAGKDKRVFDVEIWPIG